MKRAPKFLAGVFLTLGVIASSCDGCFWTPHVVYGPFGLGPAGGQCLLDGDCGEGYACEREVCVAICASDAECVDGEVCRAGDNTEEMVCKPIEDEPPADAGTDADSSDAAEDGASYDATEDGASD